MAKSKKVTKVNRKFAFWKYDLFPFVLGGEVEQFLDDGRIVPVGYAGYRFRPAIVMSYNVGRKLMAEIDQISQRRNLVLDTVNHSFNSQLKAIAPFAFKK